MYFQVAAIKLIFIAELIFNQINLHPTFMLLSKTPEFIMNY